MASRILKLVAFGVVCAACGVRPPPPLFSDPAPAGHFGAYRCEQSAHAPAPARSVPVAFDSDWTNWPQRDEASQHRLPITRPEVRAGDVYPGWSQDQIAVFPRHARDSALVPIGGDYFQDTPYPVAPPSRVPWISTAFSGHTGAAFADRGDEKVHTWIASTPFTLSDEYLNVPVGGKADDKVGVELWVEAPDGTGLTGCEEKPRRPPDELAKYLSGFVRVSVRRPTGSVAREAMEAMDIHLMSEHCKLKDRKAVLYIFDDSDEGHINVGAIELRHGPTKKDDEPVHLWGFSDFHTHPTDNLSLGGLQDVHTLWGAPGGAMSEYVSHDKRIEEDNDDENVKKSFTRDIPPCDGPQMGFNAHHGGYSAPTMINGVDNRISQSMKDLTDAQLAYKHGSQGGPTFVDFPDFRSGSHEQYHITQIHRAYLGGLRLISALALHNEGLEYGMGWVRCGPDGTPTVDTTSDWTLVRAHARAMKQLAQLNKDWMEIAYSPADARRIIGQNKLAVVLGVEVPRLGEQADGSPEEQVRELHRLGIRQVIMVHGMDNALGGTAIFQDLYNTVNDWMHRPPKYHDRVETLSGLLDWRQFDASFFEITTAPSPSSGTLFDGEAPWPTEPIQFRLSKPERIVLSDVFPRPGAFSYKIPVLDKPFGVLHTLFNTTPLFAEDEGTYDKYQGGHRNKRGLTGRGAEFLEQLMSHGMLVDLAHMSEATLFYMYDITAQACPGYPLMISHAHFRKLAPKVDYSDRAPPFEDRTGDAVRDQVDSLARLGEKNHDDASPMSMCIQNNATCDEDVLREATQTVQLAPQLGPGTVNKQNLPREYDIPSSELQQVRARQGAIGVFLGQGPVDGDQLAPVLKNLDPSLTKLPFENDCAGSSKGLAAALLYANGKLSTKSKDHPDVDNLKVAVGLASDFSMTGQAPPRFGPNACAAYLGAGSGSSSGAQLLETLLDKDHYQFKKQRGAVSYSATGATSKWKGPAERWSCHKGSPWEDCGKNEPLDPYVMGTRAYNFNVDGVAHYGLVPDMLQDVANVLGKNRGLALNQVFESAERYVEMWERACALSNGACEKDAAPQPPVGDDQCKPGNAGLRRECGNACPCSWNRGAPLQEIAQDDQICDPGKPIRFPVVDSMGKPGFANPEYQQRSTNICDEGDLTKQGDWAIYPIRSPQTWLCGNDKPQMIHCPVGTNYVMVRRTLDTTVSPLTERCDFQPLPPEAGNRRVVFGCLVGPPDDGSFGVRYR